MNRLREEEGKQGGRAGVVAMTVVKDRRRELRKEGRKQEEWLKMEK